jgi:phosphinothricin acetyltransferase
MVSLRLAEPIDLDAINSIYNHYVLMSVATYQEEPSTADERLEWFASRSARHPVTVAELNGEVVGWGSLSPFRLRSGYRFSVENSIYIRHDLRRQGIGSNILSDQITRATILGYHTIIAGCDSEQAGSVALHRRFEFEEVARFRQVGFKFGRWLDVIFLQKFLNPAHSD